MKVHARAGSTNLEETWCNYRRAICEQFVYCKRNQQASSDSQECDSFRRRPWVNQSAQGGSWNVGRMSYRIPRCC